VLLVPSMQATQPLLVDYFPNSELTQHEVFIIVPILDSQHVIVSKSASPYYRYDGVVLCCPVVANVASPPPTPSVRPLCFCSKLVALFFIILPSSLD
jgi:hypothetical protein